MKDYKQLVAQAVYAAVDGPVSEKTIVEKLSFIWYTSKMVDS